MTVKDIENKIVESFPGSTVEVRDLTGTEDHYQALVVSPAFEGKTMIQQHRMVKAIFDEKIQSGELHALSLKTYSPQEWLKHGR